MKEHWELIMRGLYSVKPYQKKEFSQMEAYCKHILDCGMEKYFEIKYYQNDKLIETVEINDYFGINN